MVTEAFRVDHLGPELVIQANNPRVGLRGVVVIDNSTLGPCGGGTRMAPDITVQEIADLARGMTYKFGIVGLPRGGSKAGVWGDPGMPAEKKRAVMSAFGEALAPYIQSKRVALGPDMGVGVADVADIYQGADTVNLRSGLFRRELDGDPAAYHITGFGAVAALKAACAHSQIDMEGTTVAVEGFGQVGVGVARYAAQAGARVVAVSTIKGAVYDPEGLDVAELLGLRREVGDDCILKYKGGRSIDSTEIYFLPVDVLIPGARPYVINESNYQQVQSKLIVPGGNIPITGPAEELLAARGTVVMPDFLSSAGAAIASWVDFLSGTTDQAFAAIDRLIGSQATHVLEMSKETGDSPTTCGRATVESRIRAAADLPRKSFDDIKIEIKALLRM